MQGNRSRDTKPELASRSAVHRRGIRFRAAARPQPEPDARTADMVPRKTRIAVFVDGCYLLCYSLDEGRSDRLRGTPLLAQSMSCHGPARPS